MYGLVSRYEGSSSRKLTIYHKKLRYITKVTPSVTKIYDMSLKFLIYRQFS